MKKVITIGPSIERTKGGMASVIQGLVDSQPEKYGYQIEHIISHVEDGAFTKLGFFIHGLFKFITKRQVSLVHIHAACDASFYRKAIFAAWSRLKGIPVFMHIHGADFDSFYLNTNAVNKAIIKRSLKSCNRVIVLSNYWKVFFEENLGLDNIDVLYNAVNCEAFNYCCTIPQNLNNFLFLGRLGERKGIYDLVKAIDILVNKQNFHQLKFYFAGDGEIEEVKKIVDDLNLNDNISILGWVNNEMKPGVLLKADTVVLPSYNEGLPVALLEAMAAGKVILSTPVGGIPDLVTDGVNGFLIQPGDVNAMVEKIKYISQNADEMMAISKNNIEKIETQFNSIHINEQLFNSYSLAIKK